MGTRKWGEIKIYHIKCIYMEMGLQTLEIYTLACDLSKKCRKIYELFDYQTRKIVWDQYIRSIDSIWANIAEWYGRFHYLDSVKFYYNARWSLLEAIHRTSLLHDRKFLPDDIYNEINSSLEILSKRLNTFIKVIKSKTT